MSPQQLWICVAGEGQKIWAENQPASFTYISGVSHSATELNIFHHQGRHVKVQPVLKKDVSSSGMRDNGCLVGSNGIKQGGVFGCNRNKRLLSYTRENKACTVNRDVHHSNIIHDNILQLIRMMHTHCTFLRLKCASQLNHKKMHSAVFSVSFPTIIAPYTQNLCCNIATSTARYCSLSQLYWPPAAAAHFTLFAKSAQQLLTRFIKNKECILRTNWHVVVHFWPT